MFDTSDLARFQSEFLHAVTGREPPAANLRIFHDTWFYGLLDGLREVYPVTLDALGDGAFNAFARDYIHARPSGSNLNSYGAALPDFLAAHPALSLDWLPDLARFEWAHHAAHHAADVTPCSFEDLLDPADRVALHPSLQVLDLRYDVKGLYAALSHNEPPPRVRAIACQSLIGRGRDDAVVHLCLAPLEVEFIALIRLSGALTTALEQLDPTPDDMTLLQTLLAGLVHHGLIVHFSEETP